MDIEKNERENSDGVNNFEDPSKIFFKNPVPQPIADYLVLKISEVLLPLLMDINPDYSLEPIYNENNELIAINFMNELNPVLKEDIKLKIRELLDGIIYEFQKQNPQDVEKRPTENRVNDEEIIGFNELLGTYRVGVLYIYIPLLITIFSAIFLAYITRYTANLEFNGALIDPEEKSTMGIILNGLVPVLISALIVTLLWLGVKKYGIKVFRNFMGFIVIFYDWYGFIFYVEVVYVIIYNWLTTQSEGVIQFFIILYYLLHWGTLAGFIYLGYLFFKNRLSSSLKNLLVIMFGIFLGSLVGISFPTWTTISFAIFLSIWDLITVFRGPLGKLANVIMENRKKIQEEIAKKIENGEIDPEEAANMGFGSISTLDEDISFKEIRKYLKNIKVEIGSGDLILYSALIAHVYVSTLNWTITLMTMAGVLLGVLLTMYYLFKKKRVLPALPFSMFIGITIFLSMAIPMGYL